MNKDNNYISLDKAIWKLKERFKSKKAFLPSKFDKRCLNSIINWINDEKKRSLENNRLFAKLYIYFLNQNIDKFETTVFDDIPQKNLSRLLNMPLDSFYISFKNSFDQNNRLEVLNSLGIEINHLNTNKQDREKLKNISKEQLIKFTNSQFDLLTIEVKLNEMVTEALNRFSKL